MQQRLDPDSSDGSSFGEDWAEQNELDAESYRCSGIRIFYSDVSSGCQRSTIIAGFAVICSTLLSITLTPLREFP